MLCFSLAECACRSLWSTSGFAFRWPPLVDHTQDTLAFQPAVFPSNPCFSLAEPTLLSTLLGRLIVHHLPRFQFPSGLPSDIHPAILALPFECAAPNRPNLHPVHSSGFLSSFLLSPIVSSTNLSPTHDKSFFCFAGHSFTVLSSVAQRVDLLAWPAIDYTTTDYCGTIVRSGMLLYGKMDQSRNSF